MIGRIVLLLIVLAAVAAYTMRGELAMRVYARAAQANMGADLLSELPDGLHVALCGAGSPFPDPQRSGPCLAIIAGKQLLVVDAGTGGARNLQRMDIPAGQVAAVLLTHFHSDHIDGLGELAMLRWVGDANTTPLPVLGPEGVEQVVQGFNEAYRLDAGYRTAHHGVAVAPPKGAGMRAETFALPADGRPVTVWEKQGLRVVAFAVDHTPVSPAVGYRFDYAGRSVVVSGDTKKNANVATQAEGADLLVHEALAAQLVGILNQAATATNQTSLAKITHDVPDYHATPVEAAEIAAASGVEALLYYHIVPSLILPGLEAAFLQGVDDAYDGEVVVGRDGTLASLSGNSEEIEFSHLL